jgi:G3E family GTPase
MVGGFLGAGKTTAIARLGRHYVAEGHKVGLVANDQAHDLVDTQWLRAQGFHVGEVPGACFCCKFSQLMETISSLRREESPDVIIAEPVGSCSDVAATVIEPLRNLHGHEYECGPLVVLLKPEHGKKILRRQQRVGFSPKAAYIFLKQIEEADVVVVNKIDKLALDEREELVGLVSERFPGKAVLAASARTGEGFDAVIDALKQSTSKQTTPMHVEFDICAEGEAELAWLNCQVRVEGGVFELDDLLVELVRRLQQALLDSDAEPAHVKVLGQVDGRWAIANLVGSDTEVELSSGSGIKTRLANLTVNARVAVDHIRLEAIVRQLLADLTEGLALRHTVRDMQSFRPGRSRPTHRIS